MTASLKLIKKIKGIAYKFESQKKIYLALGIAKCTFYVYKHQGGGRRNERKLHVEVQGHHRGD